MVEVVEADLENAEHVQAILQLLNTYAQEPLISGKPLAERVRCELIDGLQQHPTTVVLLAYQDQQAVGIAVCFVGFSTFAARPLLNIHDFAVLAEFRGQGIGRELLAATERKALELGCCKLTLEVDGNNFAARRVYESFGFDSTQHVEDNGQALFFKKQLDA
ncbi:MAG: GNAT family N-acetyltransferase [Bythopirellula sp.]